ncbi:MAG: type II secretion system F family protein [Moraxellaceae bacterium]|nr:type II secretion system F family protein [Moraxellaceae bacterium]
MFQQSLMNGHWCRALATLLLSGLDTQSALSALKEQATDNVALQRACLYAIEELKQGASLTQALANYGFFNRYHVEQLRVAELSGKIPAMLASLATRLEQQYERQQRLRTQLKLSQAVIIIGLLASVFLAVAREQSLWPQCWQLVLIVVITKALFRVLSLDILLLLAMAWTYQWLLKIALVSRLFEYYWYNLWLLQSDAGVDNAQVLFNLRDLFSSSNYRHHNRIAQRYLEEGNTLLFSLSQAGLILTSPLKQVILVGEKSGKLTQAVNHHLTLEKQRIDIIIVSFYEWLPRIYYVLALGIVLDTLL